MVKLKPHNYICVQCEKKQYTNQKCYGCGGVVFSELANNDTHTISLTDEELDIIQHWGFIASTERSLSADEKELYFKISNG